MAECLSQQDEDTAAILIKNGWPEVFAAAKHDLQEAFASWKIEPVENS